MNLQLIRNATLLLEINQKKILIDPMLGELGSINAIPLTQNKIKNPIIPLPISLEEIITVDAIFITHMHFDHFDDEAKRVLAKDIPVFCQPKDANEIRKAGFLSVTPIKNSYTWEGIKISRIKGKHGSGLSGLVMGMVSGFILEDNNRKNLYIAGDTIYNNCVRKAISAFNPNFIVVNSGEAKLILGEPITMTKEEVLQIAKDTEESKIIVIHLETLNHCNLSRKELNQYLNQNGTGKRVIVPNDGEILEL